MAKLSSYLRGNTTITGITTYNNIIINSGESTGTADQNLQVSGGSYISGNTGIGSAIPQAKLDVLGDSIVSGISTASEFSLSALDSSIADTAVDVFVYDTSKDSDGGAWRKRTQHTSWYNETLNTATRGSRREFPAVAVIVAEGTKLTIYDGDDPDLPMWMVFNLSGAVGAACNMLPRGGSGSESDITSVAFLNSKLVVGLKDVDGSVGEGPIEVNFISDFSRVYREVSSGYTGAIYNLPISGRNSNGTYSGDYNTLGIIAQTVNDVAMTVLPNAPIDDATGLPIPTIAVATLGGVSVIKDDGTVVDITGQTESPYRITFNRSNPNEIITSGYWTRVMKVYKIPSSDVNESTQLRYYVDSQTPKIPFGSGAMLFESTQNKELIVRVSGGTPSNGFYRIAENLESKTNGMVAHIKPEYNTGWMHGDIKGAFLSDTDATNVSADTLNSVNTFDGTFATSTGWTVQSDWTISGGVATCNGAGSGRFIYPFPEDSWTIGSSVVVEVTVTAYTSGTLFVSYSNGTETAGTNMTATGTYKFVGTVSANTIVYIGSTSFVGSIDNVKIYYAEEDRSVNNKGLAVYGTITKTPVATGAELVAYSNFSGSNYLEQPYNSDLDFGTGDFSFISWVKHPNTFSGGHSHIISKRNPEASGQFTIQYGTDSTLYLRFNANNFADIGSLSTNIWQQIAFVRRGGVLYGYKDGNLISSDSFNDNISNNESLRIGCRYEDGSGGYIGAWTGSIALLRVSASAPSAEQVKKIYEDEKVLFQENAACTLYGSSDAVTALAYDEDLQLLQVGTSSGRSDFQGLRRINNTTTAVTTAISASNGLVAEQ